MKAGTPLRHINRLTSSYATVADALTICALLQLQACMCAVVLLCAAAVLATYKAFVWHQTLACMRPHEVAECNSSDCRSIARMSDQRMPLQLLLRAIAYHTSKDLVAGMTAQREGQVGMLWAWEDKNRL